MLTSYTFFVCPLIESLFNVYDVTKVEPTKLHLVSHTYNIQGFVSDGLYLMVKILYFYKIHT
jgi:hypothetical protein